MSKKARFTQEQIAEAARLKADCKSQTAIASEMSLGIWTTRNLLREVEVSQAAEKLRLTDVIPQRLSHLADTTLALVDVVEKLEARVAKGEEVARMMTKAMKRLQVENKTLRETRRDAKAELRKVKADLWKARGY